MTDKKPLSESDKSEILNVLNGVAYLLDARLYERLGEIFSADIHFENPGRLTADGVANVIGAMREIPNPAISHHITNVIITPGENQTARAVSKALTVRHDKSMAAAEYTDVLKRTDAGWRISSRLIRPLT